MLCIDFFFWLFSFPCIKVRQLGRIMDVPEGFLKRHPFPGPGLAVRVLGDVTEGNALDVLRQVHGAFVLVFVYSIDFDFDLYLQYFDSIFLFSG